MFYCLIIDLNASWSPRFSVWKTNQLWSLLQITSFSLKLLKKSNELHFTVLQIQGKGMPIWSKQKCPHKGKSHFSLLSFPKSKHLMLSKQFRHATNTWHIQIKALCHLSSQHNFSFSLYTKLQQVEEISFVMCCLEWPIHKSLKDQVV